MRKYFSVLVVLVVLVTSFEVAPVQASTFDEETGRLSISDAVVGLSFDSVDRTPAEVQLTVMGTDWLPVSPATLESRFVNTPDGLEGEGALSIGGSVIYGNMLIGRVLPAELVGRRIEVRIWQRPEGTRARLSLSWYNGDPSAGAYYFGSVPFLPTGRATDDGWLEFSTGPVDFAAGGVFGPSAISFLDGQVLVGDRSFFAAHEQNARVLLDALEVLDVGPAIIPTESCTAINEHEVCGDAGLCHLGRCLDAAIVAGPIPANDRGVATDYFDRRIFEYREFEGGRIPQSNMNAVEDAFAAHDTAAAHQFWPNIRRALDELGDGHVSGPFMTQSPPVTVGTCLHFGEADLLPPDRGVQLPLVFSTADGDPISEELHVGDALVEIDGLSPEDWSAEASRLLTYTGDPRGYTMFTAPYLLRAAILSGSTLTFARCARSGDEMTACTDGELEILTFDTSELVGSPLWSGAQLPWLTGAPPLCDYRFQNPLSTPPLVNLHDTGWTEEEGVRLLLINGVPGLRWEGGAAWHDAVEDVLDPVPARLIIDQRRGDGGSIEATDFLVTQLMAEDDFFAMDLLPHVGDATLEQTLLEAVDHCATYANGSCGGAWRWELGAETERSVTDGVAAESRLALVNSFDVSGNDYVTRLLTYRSGPTRVFGPAPSFGAFGPINTLPAHLDELHSGSLQHHDTVFRATPDDDTMEFSTGIGVAPDVVVMQRQSDALRGIDTLIETARAWLNEEEL